MLLRESYALLLIWFQVMVIRLTKVTEYTKEIFNDNIHP